MHELVEFVADNVGTLWWKAMKVIVFPKYDIDLFVIIPFGGFCKGKIYILRFGAFELGSFRVNIGEESRNFDFSLFCFVITLSLEWRHICCFSLFYWKWCQLNAVKTTKGRTRNLRNFLWKYDVFKIYISQNTPQYLFSIRFLPRVLVILIIHNWF